MNQECSTNQLHTAINTDVLLVDHGLSFWTGVCMCVVCVKGDDGQCKSHRGQCGHAELSLERLDHLLAPVKPAEVLPSCRRPREPHKLLLSSRVCSIYFVFLHQIPYPNLSSTPIPQSFGGAPPRQRSLSVFQLKCLKCFIFTYSCSQSGCQSVSPHFPMRA